MVIPLPTEFSEEPKNERDPELAIVSKLLSLFQCRI